MPFKKMVMKKILKDNYFKIHRLKINYCIFFFLQLLVQFNPI